MTESRFGGFWRRAMAYGIDKTILQISGMILFISGLLIFDLNLPAYRHGREWGLFGTMLNGRFIFGYYAITVLMDMVYFTWFHGVTGQTPGKILMRLRVVQENDESLTFGLAFLRWVGYMISAIPAGFGFIWIAFDRKKRGWHDRIAGTVVVCYEKMP
jgi:uncharacterized RDD family membrane protein YckC